jgi:hypothetical protein
VRVVLVDVTVTVGEYKIAVVVVDEVVVVEVSVRDVEVAVMVGE